MATVINNPEPRERVIERDDGSGWAVAVIILFAMIIAGVFLWQNYNPTPGTPNTGDQGSTNINVTIPKVGGEGSINGGTAPTPTQ